MNFKKTLFPVALLYAGLLFITGCGSEPEVTDSPTTLENQALAALSKAPDVAIQAVIHAVGEADGSILWAAMPASYQSDVTGIVQLAGQKIDAELYDRSFATITRLMQVADKKKEFVFNASLGQSQDPEELALLRQSWPSLVNVVHTLGTSPLATTAGLQGFEGERFFSDTVSSLLRDFEALSALDLDGDDIPLSGLRGAVVSLLESTASTATLQVNLPDGSEKTEMFVKVEDRWVPQEMHLGWAEQIAQARVALEAIDSEALAGQKTMAMTVFAIIDGVLLQVEAAETQAEFDQALQGAMMPIMGMLMMGGQAPGGAMNPPAMP